MSLLGMLRARHRSSGASIAAAILLLLAFATAPARGAMFDDDEARKRIEACAYVIDH
jgi:hypothetical protein